VTDYDIQNLGAIGFVVDMNNFGQLAGYTTSGGPEATAILYSNGLAKTLGILPGFARSAARAINNLGEIVGSCDNPPSGGHAFIYKNGSMADLHPLLEAVGYTWSDAMDNNDQGMIVGTGNLGPWLIRNGKATILKQAPGVPSNALFPAISSSGIVALGTADESGLYSYDSNTNLSKFLGSFGPNVSVGSPSVINDSGYIAGIYRVKSPSGPNQAYLYTQSSNLQALGIEIHGGQLKCPDLNGYSQMVFGSRLMYDNGVIVDLQSVLPPNVLRTLPLHWSADFINDQGQLVCHADLPGNVYLLTPVSPPPVPGLSADKVAEIAASVRVLVGVVEGGGGLVILPNGSIIRIPPGGPPPGDPLTSTVFQLLSRLASGLAVRESASTIADSQVRAQVQAAGVKFIRMSLQDALASLTESAPKEPN
jgi:probable HAF family extracellular repeat protein